MRNLQLTENQTHHVNNNVMLMSAEDMQASADKENQYSKH